MGALHRYLLWSVRWRKYDVVNFIIQATGIKARTSWLVKFSTTTLDFSLRNLNLLCKGTRKLWDQSAESGSSTGAEKPLLVFSACPDFEAVTRTCLGNFFFHWSVESHSTVRILGIVVGEAWKAALKPGYDSIEKYFQCQFTLRWYLSILVCSFKS